MQVSTVESRKFEVLGTRGFISKYRKLKLSVVSSLTYVLVRNRNVSFPEYSVLNLFRN